MSYPDEPQDDEYPAYLSQQQFSRPANGGNVAPVRTAVGGDMPPAGPAHLLAASRPPQPSKPDGGGTTYFAAPASPGQDAGGAFASMSSPTFGQTRPNAGGASVSTQPTYGGAFGNYAPHQAPRPAAMPRIDSPAPAPPQRQGALDMFNEQLAARQASQGGQQGMQQDGGNQGEDAGAAEGEAAEGAEGAEAAGVEGAGAAGAGGAAEGLELAAMFL